MKTRTQLLALLAALPLAGLSLTACGGGDPATLIQEGKDAMNSGDPAGAQKKLSEALAELEPGAPQYVDAKTAYLRAKAHTDGEAAATEFLEFAEAADVDARQYRQIVLDLTEAGAFVAATEVLKAGKERLPEYDRWDELIQQAGKRAEAAGDAEALESLKGLGYIGE
jgi:hypothetical protein